MTNVRIPAGAVQLQHLGPKVTARALGGITCVVQAAAPASPNPGDLWVNPANDNQISQWTGAQWFAVPINAGSLTGENFNISASGEYHYASPPAFQTWSFEAGLQGWEAVNATVDPSPAWSYTGGYSALLAYASGTSWSFISPPQTVQTGNQVYVSAWVNAPQALGAVGLQLQWLNSGGTLISTSSAPTAPLPANTPAQLTWNADPPSGAVSCQIVITDDEISVTGYQLFIDDVYISGQLSTAIAPAAGTDLLGNAHYAGVSALGVAGAQAILAADENNIPWVAFIAGVDEETSHGRLQVQVNNAGTATESLGLYLGCPTVTGQSGIPSVAMFSASKDLSAQPYGMLGWVTGGADQEILTWNNGGISANRTLIATAGLATAASSLSGGVIISQTDIGFTPQTNPTSPSRICKVWPIPAGDPVTATVYRLSMPFSGHWEGNPLSFQIAGLGETLGNLVIGGDLMSAGVGFCGDLTATLIVNQTTSGEGILTGSIRCNLGVSSAGQLPTGGANGAGGFVGLSVVESIPSIGASASSIAVQAWFAASNSGQSIEGFGSVLERIGGGA